MATSIIEEPKDKRTFTVEQLNNDFITVKKKKNNKEYEVEVVLFTQFDIDEFKKIQEEIYRFEDKNRQDLMYRLVQLLKKLENK